jgi:hypothetical protein
MSAAHAFDTQTTLPVDRRSPAKRRQMSPAAMRAFFNVAEKWKLSVEEARGLLGWLGPSTYHKYKSGDVGTLGVDILMRISIVIGIYKALHILYPQASLADGWVKLPNTNALFGGSTPLAVMMDGGMDAMTSVRRLLDSRRGGWN